jgi:cell division protein FtsB
VVLYAAFIGLLLASYVTPLQGIFESRAEITALETGIAETERENAAREVLAEELTTPEGVERAARERYGMVKSGEKVYIVPEDGE